MTDNELIMKLAERFDPEPSADSGKWGKWYDRRAPITSALAIATPGAVLGALVDLCIYINPNEAAAIATLTEGMLSTLEMEQRP